MGFGSNDDNDNDIPDWLKGLQSEDDTGGFESEEDIFSEGEDVPDWLEEDATGGFSAPEPSDEEDVPDWLASIREETQNDHPAFDPGALDDLVDADDDAWLRNIPDQHSTDQGEPEPEAPESGDYLETIHSLKEEDEISAAWGEAEESGAEEAPEEQGPIKAAWEADTGTLVPQDDFEEVPDWVSKLPTVEPKTEPHPPREDHLSEDADEEVPPWLQEIRSKTTEETRPPEDVLPAFGLDPEDMFAETPADPAESIFGDEEAPIPEPPATQKPPNTGSLPTWMEDLQTSGKLELPETTEDEGEAEALEYSEEDVSTLFEDDDLLDWLEEEEEELPEPTQKETLADPEPDLEEGDIEKADLPTWLQAMRPVEAVTADIPEETEEVEVHPRKRETIGPLSGLSDVLPAEPGIVHFGSKPKPAAAFGLTEQQKKYAHLLKSLVKEEAAYEPVAERKVANPQQVLRWVIAILLLSVLFAVAWLNGDFIALPTAGFPEENLAAVSLVNDLQAGDKVLVAFEYQPGLSGEMEAASSALMEHLLLKQAELVLVSTQPVGPGLAEAFLQGKFDTSAYILEKQYANLGYLSGGTAGLLNFATTPRQTVPSATWDASPLDSVQSVKDFAMVLVLTDDPDIARSWIEQVQPLLTDGTGQAIPLVMVTSAQAEPLVYPYYLSDPRQVSGLVSGVSGGAYYENQINAPSLARRYWDSYNVGLLLAVIVIAAGSIINLARTPLRGKSEGRS
ncbi:hypothetical protein KQH61_04805 [bacterium]|nr:hypothetical protein [bacterium]MCB2179221.1 hypothetical protein [bacterium]